MVYTDADGVVLEERRYEPFGGELDARTRGPGGGYVIGPPDRAARDINALNKRTDLATGWSDHGARWLAPETARWLTPDPPLQGVTEEAMETPWALHPYQYVDQNPIAYWDPDGNQPAPTTCSPAPAPRRRSTSVEVYMPTQRFLVTQPKAIHARLKNDLGKLVASKALTPLQAKAIATHVMRTLRDMEHGIDPGSTISKIVDFRAHDKTNEEVELSRGSSTADSNGGGAHDAMGAGYELELTGGIEFKGFSIGARGMKNETQEHGTETSWNKERGTEEGTSTTRSLPFEIGAATLSGSVRMLVQGKEGQGSRIVTVPITIPRGTVHIEKVR